VRNARLPYVTRKARIPVTILTGFLGSGKTTLLNDLLSDPSFRDTAIIVNEFGDVSVDHDLIRIGEREMMVTTTGCLCCTAGSDIRVSLSDLLETARTDPEKRYSRVIVETTGLADMAPVINQIVAGAAPAMGLRDHTVARSFRLAGVVCLVDAVLGPLSLERHFECLKQVAFADRIVLTKTDMVHDPASRTDLEAIRTQLRAVNPTAVIDDRHDPAFDLADLFAPRDYAPADLGPDVEGWLALEAALAETPEPAHTGPKTNRHAEGGIQTVAIVADAPVRSEDFDRFYVMLQMAAGTHLLRLKGVICQAEDPERPLVVQSVQHGVHPPKRLEDWPSEDRRTRIVAITHDVEPSAIQDLFATITGQAGPKRPRRFVTAGAIACVLVTLGAWALLTWKSPAAAPATSPNPTAPHSHAHSSTAR